jgi:hypothetical protein
MPALRDQVTRADLVLTGRVASVRTVEEAASARRLGTVVPSPISEHVPVWHEAVVDVQSVEKGAAREQVLVRFPTSTDVRWYEAPKLEPGQEAVFLLRRRRLARARAPCAPDLSNQI